MSTPDPMAQLAPLAGLSFTKMTGTGNDFILMDNRQAKVPKEAMPLLAEAICKRSRSVGADGLILLSPSARVDPKLGKVDFLWDFFNADGSSAEMCGNGARCAARFAVINGIAGEEMAFETDAGVIAAQVNGERVRVRMTDPADLDMDKRVETRGGPLSLGFVDTGVPHVVLPVGDVDGADVLELGRELRYHPAFAPQGANVNFTALHKDGRIFNRTYERGVEGETLACGTGSVAAALIMADRANLDSPVTVVPRSGEALTVYYDKAGDRFHNVFLEGNARVICTGEFWEDAWNWTENGGTGNGFS